MNVVLDVLEGTWGSKIGEKQVRVDRRIEKFNVFYFDREDGFFGTEVSEEFISAYS